MLYACMLAALVAAPRSWSSTPRQTHLLELYSSEGCSSCPPAEARLRSLKEDPGLWRTFVPVEFHVDYWDSLGWTDPYAQPAFTRRQRDYAAAWRSESVYTPCWVADGAEARGAGGSDQEPGPPVGVLHATEAGERTYTLEFVPERPLRGPVTLSAALLAGDVRSQVRRGENRGRSLAHDFVVLSLASAQASRTAGGFSATLVLPPNAAARAQHVAFWVTVGSQVVQATGGDL